uniref:Uncharacterized protein n=1 Tax=Romanomermis culicivorax TaxID=13658 RepID=A0A915HKX1_ROMCU
TYDLEILNKFLATTSVLNDTELTSNVRYSFGKASSSSSSPSLLVDSSSSSSNSSSVSTFAGKFSYKKKNLSKKYFNRSLASKVRQLRVMTNPVFHELYWLEIYSDLKTYFNNRAACANRYNFRNGKQIGLKLAQYVGH